MNCWWCLCWCRCYIIVSGKDSMILNKFKQGVTLFVSFLDIYVHKMCGRTYGQTNMKRTITLTKINLPWNRYNMHMLRSWPTKIPNMNKMRQTTNDLSCVHKMCEWTYGQTNMKMAITLAKINHPWNRYNMRILRSWPTKILKIPNMNKIQQKTNDYTRFRDGRTDGQGVPVYPPVRVSKSCTL